MCCVKRFLALKCGYYNRYYNRFYYYAVFIRCPCKDPCKHVQAHASFSCRNGRGSTATGGPTAGRRIHASIRGATSSMVSLTDRFRSITAPMLSTALNNYCELSDCCHNITQKHIVLQRCELNLTAHVSCSAA